MDHPSFHYWCRVATSEIRYKPDRKAVYLELLQHLLDRYDTFIDQGLDHKEATQKTMEAMGSPAKVAAQLGDVHRPFWGYMLRAFRSAFLVLLCMCLIAGWSYCKRVELTTDLRWNFDVFSSDSYGGETGRTLLHLSQPNSSFSADGSTFVLTDAAVYTTVSNTTGEEKTWLDILLRRSSLLPWQEYTQDLMEYPLTSYFVAKDDQGNVYPLIANGSRQTAVVQSGIFSCVYECWIADFPSDAQWVNICYERDGRQYALHIDLTGGDTE